MRHQKKKLTLDRKASSRQALVKNLAESLILFEKITTTKAKAKAARSYTEKLITKSKVNTLAARRELLAHLYTKNAVKKLLEVIGPRYAKRDGGYTRIITLTRRAGDGAEMAVLELI